MLKRIAVADLRLGMHLHALEGNWLANPSWRSRFVLKRESDLELVHSSGIARCWIDIDKGSDVRVPAGPTPSPNANVSEARATRKVSGSSGTYEVERRGVAPPPDKPAVQASMAEELPRAAVLLKESQQSVESLFGQARLGVAIDVDHCAPLVAEIIESTTRHSGAMIGLARLKTQDDYAHLHSVAVCALMVSLAQRLGLSESDTHDAGIAGLLLDLGKAVMPPDIINKPGKLSDAEYTLIQTHPERGHALLSQGVGVPAAALDLCLHQHERPDGKGYPNGISGDALSRVARMGAICAVYDAISSNRPYKVGLDPAESIASMAKWAQAGQFDKPIFDAFVECLGIYPTGSLVRLHSGRLGVVVEQNEAAVTKPWVKAFFSTRSQMPIPHESIDTSAPDCGDHIVARESNDTWQFSNLSTLWVEGRLAHVLPQCFHTRALPCPEAAMIEMTLPTMTCAHCVRTVTETAQRVDPQAQVEIDLATHRVRIESASDREAFTAALTEEGYAPA